MRRALSLIVLASGVAMACGDSFTSSDESDASGVGNEGGGDDDGLDSGGETGILVGPDAGGRDASHPPDGSTLDATQGEDASEDTSPPPDASTSGMDATTPPIDATPLMDTFVPPPTDACAVETPNLAQTVFVSAGAGNTSCGSEASPCGSIQTAINVAHADGYSAIYVSTGTYTEQITLVSGITIQGGWHNVGGTWSRDCSGGALGDVTIKAPAGDTVTVIANGATGVTLDTLSVASEDEANVGTAQSVFGIFASNGATLTLTNVDVSVVAGGTGTSGVVGGAGTAATAQCSPASDGLTGAGGTPGAPGAAGAYSAGGYSPATGGTGGVGGTGDTGTAPPPQGQPNGIVCISGGSSDTCTQYDDPQNEPCPIPAPVPTGQTSCGNAGTSGCGGGGSSGGTGGGGGGSSIALFVWGATASVTGGTLSSDVGGTGGPGGSGGDGGAGAMGVQGSIGPSITTACTTRTFGGHQACTANSVSGTGSTGGTGGKGGTGGTGGGGAGGDSYAWYAGGGGSVSTTNTTLTHGAGGTGGAGGTMGPSGTGADHN